MLELARPLSLLHDPEDGRSYCMACLHIIAVLQKNLVLVFSIIFCRGKFGVVYHCKSLATSEPLAVKIMLKKGNKVDDVQREVSILKKLDHPGILQTTDFMESEDVYVLVTEL